MSCYSLRDHPPGTRESETVGMPNPLALGKNGIVSLSTRVWRSRHTLGGDMLAKQMERMMLGAIGSKAIPVKWIMTRACLDVLRNIERRDEAWMDAPRLIELDEPTFMGIPIEIGEPGSADPPVDLVSAPIRGLDG